jgi:F-type H+-transporting ATPase subunit b
MTNRVHRARLARLLATLALAAPALLSGGQAFAEEAKKGGLPQLDPHGFTPQLVWLAITFILLYVLMSRVILPGIGRNLQQREDKIAGDLDRAQELQRQAQAASAAVDKAMADARGKAQATARETADAVGADIARRQQELGQRLGKQIGEAEQRIAQARQTALANVKTVATEAAIAAYERLAGNKADPAAADRHVGDILKGRS